MTSSRRTTGIAVALLWAISALCQEPQRNLVENPCSSHLVRVTDIGTSTEQDSEVTIDGRKLLLFKTDASALDELRKSLGESSPTNVVIYAPVQSKGKMLTVRYESKPTGSYSEHVVREVPLSFLTFQEKLLQADDPGKVADREALQKMLLPEDRSVDNGKIVLFRNLLYYGLVPESLGFTGDSAVLTTSNISVALKNFQDLKSARLNPEELSVFLGYPNSEEEYKSIFKEDKNGDLRNWQQRTAEIREMKGEFGFKLIANEDYAKMTKVNVLHSMEQSKGIVWITAHSHGCFARFPGVGPIEIKPNDVANLNLEHHPFVILRICNGEENGFAKAFLVAGASSVWVNHGTIKATDANEQFRLFLKNAKSSTIMDSILAVKSQNEAAKYGTTLHVLNHENRKGGKRVDAINN